MRSGEACGEFEIEGSVMNTLSWRAFLMPLFAKSGDVIILKISSCEAWKGCGRGIPARGRPVRFILVDVEDSPHRKKFPRSSIEAGGFHVPCKTIIENKYYR